jgi:hypothetical protein
VSRGSFSTTLLDTLQYLRDNRRKTFMICPIWRELEARFVRAAKAIEENDESLPGGSERNRQLNAAAQELGRHEQEHRCKPNRDDVAAEGLWRWEEARRRIRARKSGLLMEGDHTNYDPEPPQVRWCSCP